MPHFAYTPKLVIFLSSINNKLCSIYLQEKIKRNIRPMHNWEGLFLGRACELNKLHDSWNLAQQGKPQIAVLLGETGLGKTRVVQQFYANIASQQPSVEDPYWPRKLSVGRNLSMQPVLANPDADIPWLWWSMRFLEQEGRNQLPTISPFEVEDKNLASNAEPILRKRQIKQSERKLLTSLSTIIADIVSFGGYGNIVTTIDMLNEYKVMKSHARKKNKELDLAKVKKLVEKTLDTLRLFLDSSINDAPSVPVVLVLDDAQWIDPVSLQSLFLIFEEAVKNDWPLMVLATHWEKEWNEADRNVENYEFIAFRQFYEHSKAEHAQTNKQHHAFTCITVKKLEERHLEHLVRVALPGIQKDTLEKLVKEADGNPLAIDEMLRILLDPNHSSRYFVNGHPDSELNKRGLKCVDNLQDTGLYGKIRKRFDNLNDDVQELLTVSSLFGISFQRPVIIELIVACKDIRSANKDNTSLLLRDAESIHALLQSVSENGHAFQQKLYQRVALDYLKINMEDTYYGLRLAITPVLEAWLCDEKLNTLTNSEQIQLCEFAIQDLIARNGDLNALNLSSRAFAFESLIALLDLEYGEDTKIAQWWITLVKCRANIPDCFFELLSFSVERLGLVITYDGQLTTQTINLAVDITNALRGTKKRVLHYFVWATAAASYLFKYTNRHDEASAFFSSNTAPGAGVCSGYYTQNHTQNSRQKEIKSYCYFLDEYIRFIISKTKDIQEAKYLAYDRMQSAYLLLNNYEENQQNIDIYSDSIMQYGDILLEHDGDVEKARELFARSLLIRRDSINTYGKTPSSLTGLAISIDRLATLALKHLVNDDFERKSFSESLSIRKLLIDEYGETPARLKDFGVSIKRLGNIALDQDVDTTAAKAHFTESLSIHQKLIDTYGETPERLWDISSLKRQLGDTTLSQDPSAAKELFIESLAIQRILVDMNGETLATLNAIALLKERLGDIALKYDNNNALAKALFTESVSTRRALIDTFGKKPSSLTDLAISIDRLAPLILEHDANAAKKLFTESLSIHRTLINTEGETQERLRYISFSIKQLHAIALKHAYDAASEKEFFTESVSIGRILINTHWGTPDNHRNISEFIRKLEGIAQKVDSGKALLRTLLTESVSIGRTLIDTYGETAERLSDIIVLIELLANIALEYDNDKALAKTLFAESLSIGRTLIDTYGETAERLRSISFSMNHLSNALLNSRASEVTVALAREFYAESLSIRRKLIVDHGETEEKLIDMIFSLNLLAQSWICYEQSEDAIVTAAKPLYAESLAIGRKLIFDKGETAERLRYIRSSIAGLCTIATKNEETVKKQFLVELSSIKFKLINSYGATIEQKEDLTEHESNEDLDFNWTFD